MEDNNINRQLFHKIIEREELQADYAVNGIQAIELAQRKKYDLIFLDINLPDISGFEISKQIKKYYGGEDSKIVAISAGVIGYDKETITEAGIDRFLHKPIQLDELRKLLLAA